MDEVTPLISRGGWFFDFPVWARFVDYLWQILRHELQHLVDQTAEQVSGRARHRVLLEPVQLRREGSRHGQAMTGPADPIRLAVNDRLALVSYQSWFAVVPSKAAPELRPQ